MPDDMTAEEAIQLVQKLRSADGIPSLRTAFQKTIENKKMQLATIQGEINGLIAAARMLDVLDKHVGLTLDKEAAPDGTASIPVIPTATVPPVPEIVPEIVDRMEKKICTYRDRRPPHGTGKWCSRKLKTKEEQTSGFCAIHAKRIMGNAAKQV